MATLEGIDIGGKVLGINASGSVTVDGVALDLSGTPYDDTWIQALLVSDDPSLDTLQELVNAIKANIISNASTTYDDKTVRQLTVDDVSYATGTASEFVNTLVSSNLGLVVGSLTKGTYDEVSGVVTAALDGGLEIDVGSPFGVDFNTVVPVGTVFEVWASVTEAALGAALKVSGTDANGTFPLVDPVELVFTQESVTPIGAYYKYTTPASTVELKIQSIGVFASSAPGWTMASITAELAGTVKVFGVDSIVGTDGLELHAGSVETGAKLVTQGYVDSSVSSSVVEYDDSTIHSPSVTESYQNIGTGTEFVKSMVVGGANIDLTYTYNPAGTYDSVTGIGTADGVGAYTMYFGEADISLNPIMTAGTQLELWISTNVRGVPPVINAYPLADPANPSAPLIPIEVNFSLDSGLAPIGGMYRYVSDAYSDDIQISSVSTSDSTTPNHTVASFEYSLAGVVKIFGIDQIVGVDGKGLEVGSLDTSRKIVTKAYVDSLAASGTVVEDVLSSTSSVNALSANQGKLLDDKIGLVDADLARAIRIRNLQSSISGGGDITFAAGLLNTTERFMYLPIGEGAGGFVSIPTITNLAIGGWEVAYAVISDAFMDLLASGSGLTIAQAEIVVVNFDSYVRSDNHLIIGMSSSDSGEFLFSNGVSWRTMGFGNGYVKAENASSTVVEDLLTSTSTVNALSANQGKLLNDAIATLGNGANIVSATFDNSTNTLTFTTQDGGVSSVVIPDDKVLLVNDLVTGGLTSALTAEQGKVLNTLVDSILVFYRVDKTVLKLEASMHGGGDVTFDEVANTLTTTGDILMVPSGAGSTKLLSIGVLAGLVITNLQVAYIDIPGSVLIGIDTSVTEPAVVAFTQADVVVVDSSSYFRLDTHLVLGVGSTVGGFIFTGGVSWRNFGNSVGVVHSEDYSVEDVLTSTSAVASLSAGQGKVLNDKILTLEGSSAPTAGVGITDNAGVFDLGGSFSTNVVLTGVNGATVDISSGDRTSIYSYSSFVGARVDLTSSGSVNSAVIKASNVAFTTTQQIDVNATGIVISGASGSPAPAYSAASISGYVFSDNSLVYKKYVDDLVVKMDVSPNVEYIEDYTRGGKVVYGTEVEASLLGGGSTLIACPVNTSIWINTSKSYDSVSNGTVYPIPYTTTAGFIYANIVAPNTLTLANTMTSSFTHSMKVVFNYTKD